MDIYLYKCESSNNTINKVMTDEIKKQIVLKENSNVRSPSIRLKLDTQLLSYNYCYIEDFERFYFISDIYLDGDVIILELRVDVLESFKEEILTSRGIITKRTNNNEFLSSADYKTEVVKEVDTYKSDKTLEFENVSLMTVIN